MSISRKRQNSKSTTPEERLFEYPHSGHLYYLIKRVQVGYIPARYLIMRIFCGLVKQGERPKPALLAYLAGALQQIIVSNNANKAFGIVRDRAGRMPARMRDDIMRIPINEKDRVLLMKQNPAYRNWEICKMMLVKLEGGHPLKKVRPAVAKKFNVSDSTVHRAWTNRDYIDPIVKAHFMASDQADDKFAAFKTKHAVHIDSGAAASRWVKESISCFSKLGRDTAAIQANETAQSSWYNLAVYDESFAELLIYRIGAREFDEHLAGISESEACDAFTRSFDAYRRKSARKARPD